MRETNDLIIRLAKNHFGVSRDNKRSTVSLLFLNAMHIARKIDPENFYSLFASITDQDQINYFHKGFRQIDVFEISSLDSLFWNILSKFEAEEWRCLDAFMKEIVELQKPDQGYKKMREYAISLEKQLGIYDEIHRGK